MNKILILLCAVSLSFAACNRENTSTDTEATDNSASTATTTTDNATASDADYEAEYRDRAARMSSKMSSDLRIDTATESRVQQVYYDHARRLDEVKRKYSYENQGNIRSGGMAADNQGDNAMNSDMIKEMEAIDIEVDNEFRSLLNPDQFKMYEANRASYWADDENTSTATDNTKRDIKVDGDEITVKTGNIKVKAEPGKSKVETKTYESKIEGDERKFKSKVDDTKIKSEDGEVKYKSDDTKIKVKDQD